MGMMGVCREACSMLDGDSAGVRSKQEGRWSKYPLLSADEGGRGKERAIGPGPATYPLFERAVRTSPAAPAAVVAVVVVVVLRLGLP